MNNIYDWQVTEYKENPKNISELSDKKHKIKGIKLVTDR